MINYFYDSYVILNKVYSEKAFIKQAINSTPIEEKNRALTIKTVYGVLEKDIELSYYLGVLAPKTPKLAIRTILKISMYAIKYLNKKEYAVVQNAVELTKKLGKSGASGFVNASLRKFIKSDIPMPKNEQEFLSVKYSFPAFAIDILLKRYGKERLENILSAHSESNTLFFPTVEGEEYLKSINANYTKTPFEKFFLVEKFIRNEDYDKGIYTFQSLGSTAICSLVDSCENLLDCCAAPGGKSINLSYKCGSVTSWDIHEHRVGLINDYSARMNVKNINAECKDSKVFDGQYADFFDVVLCDAPCSGFGVTVENPDIKLNRTLEDVKSLIKEQKSILNNVCKYVKKGGYLYYSTCSILDCENIEVVKSFLKNNDNFEICPIESPLKNENEMGAIQFLPDISSGAGFFVAKLKRVR